MASSLSTLRGLMLPTVGGDPGVWGTELNNGVMSVADNIMAGTTSLFSSNGTAVSLSQTQAQAQRISCISSSPMTVTLPSANFANGGYIFATGSNIVTVQSGGGTIVVVPPFTTSWIFSDGTNVFNAQSQVLNGSVLTAGSSQSAAVQLFLGDGTNICYPNGIAGLQLGVSATYGSPLVNAYKATSSGTPTTSTSAYTTVWQVNSSGESVGRTDAPAGGFGSIGATPGTLGEVFSIVVTAKNLANSTLTNCGAVLPTAGSYLVYGQYTMNPSGGLISFMEGGFGLGSSNATTFGGAGSATNLSFNNQIMGTQTLTMPTQVLSVTGSTYIFMLAEVVFNTGTTAVSGTVHAVRIR